MIGGLGSRPLAGIVADRWVAGELGKGIDPLWQTPPAAFVLRQHLLGNEDLVQEFPYLIVHSGVAAIFWDYGREIEQPGIVTLVATIEGGGADLAALRAVEDLATFARLVRRSGRRGR